MHAGFGQRASELCKLLDVMHPIIQAPMAGGWTTPELVVAVAEAGGLGVLAAGLLSTQELEEHITRVRADTSRPFGVNFTLAPPEAPPDDERRARARAVLDSIRAELGREMPATGPVRAPADLAEQIDLVIRVGVPVVSFAMGSPGPWIDRLRRAGTTIMATATTEEEGRTLAEDGVDIIIAQGAEAGGHRSTFSVRYGETLPLLGLVALVPRLCLATSLPVVASGGLMDGRGLAAALALGASGVQMGTRFLCARESGAFDDYRRQLARAADEDTVITWAITGRPARAIRNHVVEKVEAAGAPLPWPHQAIEAGDLYAYGIRHDDARVAPLLAGQGAGLYCQTLPAAHIVDQVVQQARAVLRGLL